MCIHILIPWIFVGLRTTATLQLGFLTLRNTNVVSFNLIPMCRWLREERTYVTTRPGKSTALPISVRSSQSQETAGAFIPLNTWHVTPSHDFWLRNIVQNFSALSWIALKRGKTNNKLYNYPHYPQFCPKWVAWTICKLEIHFLLVCHIGIQWDWKPRQAPTERETPRFQVALQRWRHQLLRAAAPQPPRICGERDWDFGLGFQPYGDGVETYLLMWNQGHCGFDP